MLFAVGKDGIRVSADNADKSTEYTCPLCHCTVVAKQGKVKAWHFAHKNKNDCDADFKTPDMSEWHRVRQALFWDRCQEVIIEDENTGEKHRADVLIYNQYVIEFQHSKINSEEFDRRNEFYTRCGYKVIWVFDLSHVIDHLSVWYYSNTAKFDWKWPWHTWDHCDFEKGNVVLLIELYPHSRDELLKQQCWSRVTSGIWMYEPDEFTAEEISYYLHMQQSPPHTYYQSFSTFYVHKYELINRMALVTPDELNKLTDHCPLCGRMYHKYRFKSKPGYYYKCYHGK